MLSSERGELLTGIECVAADGWVMEPYFVAQGEVHLECGMKAAHSQMNHK